MLSSKPTPDYNSNAAFEPEGPTVEAAVSNKHMRARNMHRAILPLVLLSGLGKPALACQCGAGPSTPCASLSSYGAIFLGTVQSVQNRPLSEFLSYYRSHPGLSWREEYYGFKDEVIVNFSVQETFKGAPSEKIALRVGKFGGSCGFEYNPGGFYFVKGQQYLVYAGSWKGHLGTTHCSPTKLANMVEREVQELRKLRGIPAPRVIGRYYIVKDYDTKQPAFGRTVTLNGNGNKIVSAVQSDGHFAMMRVAPGNYDVTASVPFNYEIGWYRFGAFRMSDRVPVNPTTIKVDTGGCTEIELNAIPDGSISGIVVDQTGKPLSGVAVRLWSANKIGDLGHWWGWNQTDNLGQFVQKPLPPGTYVLGAYIWSQEQFSAFMASGEGKPALWFYPNVQQVSRATSIRLQFAQHQSHIRMQIPSTDLKRAESFR
jgi:hypothetical protein